MYNQICNSICVPCIDTDFDVSSDLVRGIVGGVVGALLIVVLVTIVVIALTVCTKRRGNKDNNIVIGKPINYRILFFCESFVCNRQILTFKTRYKEYKVNIVSLQ